MLTLITGLPGNGKTLFLLPLVEKLRKESARDVYYWNIPQLQLPWKPLGDASTFGQKGVEPDASQAKKWYELPDGAIIVIDECQKLFRVRPQGSVVPKLVSEMETHRHKGFDLILASQNLKQIDTAVRVLVGRHYHCVRRFGFEQSTVYQWERCADPTSTRDQKEALKIDFKFPREYYDKYRSAEIHTVKKDFPWKIVAKLVGGLLLVVACVFLVMKSINDLRDRGVVEEPTSVVSESLSETLPGKTQAMSQSWTVEARTPRLEHYPESAPMFDAVLRVQSAPTVSGCARYDYPRGVVECRCTTAQGTIIREMSAAQCVEWIKYGRFDAFKRSEDRKAANVAYLNARDSRGSDGSGSLSTPMTATTLDSETP